MSFFAPTVLPLIAVANIWLFFYSPDIGLIEQKLATDPMDFGWVRDIPPAVAARLLNSPDTVRWNADKHYLADLDARGIPVVPTSFLEPGDDAVVPADAEIVVKPAVSAGSKDPARFAASDPTAIDLVLRILDSGRSAMIQPYQSAVDRDGETALVWFSGTYSHAFRKGPILRPGTDPTDDLYAAEEIGPTTPTDTEPAWPPAWNRPAPLGIAG